jgi:hypothetical protein
MNLIELKAVKLHLKKQLADLEFIKTNCFECEHLHTSQRCEKFDATPPTDWLHGTVDCEHWFWNKIPF